MAEAQVRYCTTDDGVSIAFTTMGAGMPLLITPPLGYGHIQLEMQFGPLRAWYERLAADRLVVRYDPRGNGLSQRHIEHYPDGWGTSDIDAVLGALDCDQVDLMGIGAGGLWACEYAGMQADRIRRLALWTVPADGAGWNSPEVNAALTLADKDYVAFTETMAASILGWADPAAAHAWAQFMRQAVSEDDMRMMGTSAAGWRVRSQIETFSAIRTPTLVLQPAGMRNLSLQSAQTVAAAIPGARLVICESGGGLPIADDATVALLEFLGSENAAARAASTPSLQATPGPTATAIILFADIADSTALTERLGDTAFRDKARGLDDALRTAIREHSGTVIEGKLLGDGILATFPAASQAIAAALTLEAAAEPTGLGLHIGLHAGDVLRESDADGRSNVYGGAVNIAARISALAEPGVVLVSDVVRSLARTSAGVAFDDRGEHTLKGIAEPQRVFAVRTQDS